MTAKDSFLSEDLKLLLKTTNFVPANDKLLTPGGVFDEIYLRKSGKVRTVSLEPDAPFVQESAEEARQILMDSIKKYPEFLEYMKQFQNSDPDKWMKEYGNVLRDRKMLRELLEKIYPTPGIMQFFISHQIPAITNIWVGDFIEFPKSLFERALTGVSPERLRICSICKTIFWASRLDSRACSKKCNSVRRVRKLRKKEKETVQKLTDHFQPRIKK